MFLLKNYQQNFGQEKWKQKNTDIKYDLEHLIIITIIIIILLLANIIVLVHTTLAEVLCQYKVSIAAIQ